MVDAVNVNLRRHLGPTFFNSVAGDVFGPLVGTLSMVGVLWLIVYWMYKQKLFIRI